MKWAKRTLVALALVLAGAMALPFLIPLDGHIPRIEKALSAGLKQPVSIKSIRFAALPLPHVTIDGIALGATDEIKLGRVRLTPDLFSLLQPTKVIKTIEIDSPVLTRKALDRIPAWTKSEATNSTHRAPQWRVESIRCNNALVSFGKARLGPFDARVNLDRHGEPEEASITTRDGKLRLLLKPRKSAYLIDASAKSWTLPIGPPLAFDKLIIKGVATLDQAKLNEVRAKLYGGTAVGSTTIAWNKRLRLEGRFKLSRLELRQLAPLLSPGTHVSGRLSAESVFSASSASADRLVDALRLETPFNVQNGVLEGVDIEKAATNLVAKHTTGGETRFDQLSGRLVMEHGTYHFTQLKIASGALAADGDVTISRNKELSGRINAQVKLAGVSTGVPLDVGGTLASPLLYPTAGTVAGAAAGTAILGPGLGTTVGAKVGGWVENLFGNKNGDKPKR